MICQNLHSETSPQCWQVPVCHVPGWLIFMYLYFFISICRTCYETATAVVVTLPVPPYKSLKSNISSISVRTAERTFQSPVSGVCNIQTFTLQLPQHSPYTNAACSSDLLYKYCSTGSSHLLPDIPPLKLCIDRKNPLCRTFPQVTER